MRNTVYLSVFILSLLFVSQIFSEEREKEIQNYLPRMLEVENERDVCSSRLKNASKSSINTEKNSSFRISDQAVSVRLWDAFIKDTGYFQSNHVNSYYGDIYQYVKDDLSPVIFVNWYEAVFFCNWLSQKEGLIPVYQITGRPVRDDRNTKVVINKAANGYRLPFECEWECLAGEYGNKDRVVGDISRFYNAIDSEKIANDKSVYRNKAGMLLYATKLYNVSEWVFDDFLPDDSKGLDDQTKQKKVIRQISTREGYTLDYRAPATPYGEAGLVTFRLAQTVF